MLLLQRNFLTKGSNPRLLRVSCFGRRVLYHWCHLGSPVSPVQQNKSAIHLPISSAFWTFFAFRWIQIVLKEDKLIILLKKKKRHLPSSSFPRNFSTGAACPPKVAWPLDCLSTELTGLTIDYPRLQKCPFCELPVLCRINEARLLMTFRASPMKFFLLTMILYCVRDQENS